MGFETIPETNVQYGLISFDVGGNERSGQSGLISQVLLRKVTAESITNVFCFCHGWQGDLPGAKDQYNRRLKAFMSSADRPQASQQFPQFRPLLIGLH
ncbi:MAG: hypothetical protein JOY92_11640 [Verrucomicrobia bacterium]|nr:hypothetical protein [Verrucomicrobiota bacterium]